MSAGRPGKGRRELPGFGPSMGLSLLGLTLVVVLPLAALGLRAAGVGASAMWEIATTPRVLAALRLSLGASAAAALVNVVFGTIVAWVLVRYPFPGRGVIDALVDLPFALPTAVAGIALTAVYSSRGVVGQHLEAMGLKVAFATPGIVLALTFVGLPFVIRTVEPVLAELAVEDEEAAATLGASRFTTIRRVIVPALIPAVLTGFALAFARAAGEYGSVVFIAGNMPMRTEIAPLLIMTKLESYDYPGAVTLAVEMLVISFVLLLAINRLQAWTAARARAS